MTVTVESARVGQGVRLARHTYFVDLLAILFLALLPLLFWWRLITPNPADASILKPGDLTDQFLPQRLAIAAQLQAGRFPFWNPWPRMSTHGSLPRSQRSSFAVVSS